MVSNPTVTGGDEIAREGRRRTCSETREWSILLGMDINRFTEKLQEAIRAAQSKAVRYGHQQIDVEHLLAALLEQEGGLAPSILTQGRRQRGGAAARASKRSWTGCPRSRGRPAAPTRSTSPTRLNRLLTAAEDEAAQAQGRVHLGGARAAGRARRQRRRGPPAQGVRPHPRAADAGAARGARQPARDVAESRGHLRGAGAVRPRPDQAGRAGQAGSGDRPRRGDPPRDPGALAPHQEQPGADRRAGRGQDRHRRRAGAAHRARRRAGGAEEQAHRGARHGRADRRREISAASSRSG